MSLGDLKMQINTVSLIGLGALGIMFGRHLSLRMPKKDLRIVADPERIEKYKRDRVFSNGIACDFNYVSPDVKDSPADLLIFTVKYSGLNDAIEFAKKQLGPNTIVLSLLNGISSEEIIARSYGADNILLSVAQGMDAVKAANKLTYHHMGMICFGDREPSGEPSEKVRTVARFFDKVGIPYEIADDMKKRLWGKFMLNVGVNQAVAVFECDYGGILKEGPARSTMIAAMKEVMMLSEKENINLTQADIDYWLCVLEGLSSEGKPSMRQDLEAGRPSEVELFAGTVLSLAGKHGLECPVNQMLYDRIKQTERGFNKRV